MKHWSLLRNMPLRFLKLYKKFLTTCFVVVFESNGPAASSIRLKCSIVSVGGGALLNFAILCRTSIASASFPLLIRNFGDSWKGNTKYRRKKTTRVTQPRTITSYRQPILLETVQHGAPAATEWQDGRVEAHRYLAAVPYAIPEAATTPTGCHMESRNTRNRRFCGRNSREMVASIGILPPRPSDARKYIPQIAE